MKPNNTIVRLLHNKTVQGTFILTFGGFFTRILGFLYRIFLADRINATKLGTYQLIFPVYAICFTIYGAGVQTAISQLVASNPRNNTRKIMAVGISLSLCLAFCLSSLLQIFSPMIATRILMEPGCEQYLRILALLFPFCGLSACLHGYYYGIQKARVPATTQIVEQIARICFVVSLIFLTRADSDKACVIAVWGIVVGEIVSCFYVLSHFINHKNYQQMERLLSSPNKKRRVHSLLQTRLLHSLLHLSVPLTGTKLAIALLSSVEAIFIPASLRKFGYSAEEALAVYGVLTGMVLPFILFPSSITNSIAVMLLPAVADFKSNNKKGQIRNYIFRSSSFCLIIGLFFTSLFLMFGKLIGTICFHNELAGLFLTILAWNCPFLYLSTTLNSIINGLGWTTKTFTNNVLCQSIKLVVLLFLVPHYGFYAYLISCIVSQIILCMCCIYILKDYIKE